MHTHKNFEFHIFKRYIGGEIFLVDERKKFLFCTHHINIPMLGMHNLENQILTEYVDKRKKERKQERKKERSKKERLHKQKLDSKFF